MINPFRVGRRLYFRPLEKADAPLVQGWFNDPDVTRTLLRGGPMSLAAEEALIDQIAQNTTHVAVVIALRENDRPIGVAGLHPVDTHHRHAGFGINLGAKDEWGKGYGTEATALLVELAFDSLNLHRVWLHVFEYNKAGRRTYEKVGFRQEGVLRQSHFAEGRYWDTIAMALLRDEWLARREAVGKG